MVGLVARKNFELLENRSCWRAVNEDLNEKVEIALYLEVTGGMERLIRRVTGRK